jgi:hypothetical protein
MTGNYASEIHYSGSSHNPQAEAGSTLKSVAQATDEFGHAVLEDSWNLGRQECYAGLLICGFCPIVK